MTESYIIENKLIECNQKLNEFEIKINNEVISFSDYQNVLSMLVELNHVGILHYFPGHTIEYAAKLFYLLFTNKSALGFILDDLLSECDKADSVPSQYSSIHQFFAGYRSISNIFQGFSLTSDEYYDNIVNSITYKFVHIFARQYEMISVNGQISIFKRLCVDDMFCQMFVNSLPGEVSIVVTEQLLRVSTKSYFQQTASKLVKVTQILIENCLKNNIEIPLIVDVLLLKKAYSKPIAQTVVNTILNYYEMEKSHNQVLIYLLDSIASVWGSQLSISRSNQAFQEYLTEALLECLKSVKSSTILSDNMSSQSNASLLMLLSHGISAYLDTSDAISRLRGMKVAKIFASIMGQELDFQELNDFEKQLNKEDSKSVESNIKEEKEDLNGDSDDELIPYELEEPSEQVKTTPYLRNCLLRKCMSAF